MMDVWVDDIRSLPFDRGVLHVLGQDFGIKDDELGYLVGMVWYGMYVRTEILRYKREISGYAILSLMEFEFILNKEIRCLPSSQSDPLIPSQPHPHPPPPSLTHSKPHPKHPSPQPSVHTPASHHYRPRFEREYYASSSPRRSDTHSRP